MDQEKKDHIQRHRKEYMETERTLLMLLIVVAINIISFAFQDRLGHRYFMSLNALAIGFCLPLVGGAILQRRKILACVNNNRNNNSNE